MPKINLRDLYPDFYTSDYIIEVPDEVLSVFVENERREAAFTRQMYRYRAQYSLDHDNGIEKSIQFFALSPDEIYGRKLTAQQLHAAIAALPDKQAKRIYAHYILGMSKVEIAKSEGVDEKAVRCSIERGLKKMEHYLKNLL